MHPRRAYSRPVLDPDDPNAALFAAYATVFEDLATVTTGRTRRAPRGTLLAISGSRLAALNAIISPDREPDLEEITALADDARPWDVPWSIHVRGTAPAALMEAAAGYGLTEAATEPFMVLDADRAPRADPLPRGLRVRPVGADETERYARATAAGFEAPFELFELFADPTFARAETMTCFLAEVDGVAVGTGFAATAGDLRGLFNIAVLPEHRRRGYGRAITAELCRVAFDSGARAVFLASSPMGESVYRSLGFRAVERLTLVTAP